MSQSPPVSRTMKSVPKPRALLWPVFLPQLLQYIIFMRASPMMFPWGAFGPYCSCGYCQMGTIHQKNFSPNQIWTQRPSGKNYVAAAVESPSRRNDRARRNMWAIHDYRICALPALRGLNSDERLLHRHRLLVMISAERATWSVSELHERLRF